MSLEKHKDKLIILGSVLFSLVGTLYLAEVSKKYYEEILSVKVLLQQQGKLEAQQFEEQTAELNSLRSKLLLVEESLNPTARRAVKTKQVKKAVQQTIREFKLRPPPSYDVLEVYSSSVVKWSEEYQVSIPLILAVTRQESAFQWDAVSPVGAIGMMQVMPETADSIQKELKVPSYVLNKVSDNVRFGVFYLMKMLDTFGGDSALALRAYNCGPRCVTRVIENEGKDYPLETRGYVKNILSSCIKEEDGVCVTKGYVRYYEAMGL
jgi:soluble lytic murein transglycosylase-like protein